MSTQKVTDPVIEAVSSSVLTGTLPAIDGSALTGVSGFVDTTNANDPAIDTNPATGVGTVWANSTSGEVFVCTDATTDENVWTNIGAGSGNIVPWAVQGSIAGYTLGGSGSSMGRQVEYFAFASDSSATAGGQLSNFNWTGNLGYKSTTHGYTTSMSHTRIDKFQIAGDGNGAVVADMHRASGYAAAGNSQTHGYTAGGDYPLTASIDRFDFAAESNGVDHGDLTLDRWQPSGCSSATHGYAAGGGRPGNGTSINVIDKYAFGSNANGTDVGDLVAGRNSGMSNGQASTTHGYLSGAYNSSQTAIDKWTFSSDNNATAVGDLTSGRGFSGGVSSTTHCYHLGGKLASGMQNVRDKWTFSTDGNAVDAGDLSTTNSDFGTIQT